MPWPKFVTSQFVTVTPVLPLRLMPMSMNEPGPMTEKPAQSRVMPSVSMMILPTWFAVRVVSVLMMSWPAAETETGRTVTAAIANANIVDVR